MDRNYVTNFFLAREMRNFNLIAMTMLAIFSIAITGCGNDYKLAEVTGTITYDGKPVPKLRVGFSPEPVGGNHSVGPYSKGVTDDQGRFTLKTRYDDKGAIAGKHKLSFEYSDIGESAMANLRADMNDAQDSGSKEGFEKAKMELAEVKAKLKGRPVLQAYNIIVDVPSDGLTDYKLDLKEHKPK